VNWDEDSVSGYVGQLLKQDERVRIAFERAAVWLIFKDDPEHMFRLTVERMES
jgi:hypothetical protein